MDVLPGESAAALETCELGLGLVDGYLIDVREWTVQQVGRKHDRRLVRLAGAGKLRCLQREHGAASSEDRDPGCLWRLEQRGCWPGTASLDAFAVVGA
jgi:hypothetical protein